MENWHWFAKIIINSNNFALNITILFGLDFRDLLILFSNTATPLKRIISRLLKPNRREMASKCHIYSSGNCHPSHGNEEKAKTSKNKTIVDERTWRGQHQVESWPASNYKMSMANIIELGKWQVKCQSYLIKWVKNHLCRQVTLKYYYLSWYDPSDISFFFFIIKIKKMKC